MTMPAHSTDGACAKETVLARAFAPGKAILLGEHAVVYGRPALAGALGDGVTVEVVAGRGALRVPAWNVVAPLDENDDDDRSDLVTACAAVRDVLTRRLPDVGMALRRLDAAARFGVPTGAGLGSSAALAVALARALARAVDARLGDEVLDEAALAAETVFHGRASGIDHAVAARGGFGLYTRATGLRPLPTKDGAARVTEGVRLVVGHTGRQRDTRGRVARVAELRAAHPEKIERSFDSIAALVERGAAAITTGDLAALGAAMEENQRQLEALEVSCAEIERMCGLAHEAGALGAKLTGGGGGGCVLALAPGREEAVRVAWGTAGFTSFVTLVGAAMDEAAA